MPPVNTSPATAIDITALPYSNTLDTAGASQEMTLIPACIGTAFMSVWYKYTAPAGKYFIFLGVNVTASTDAGYVPKTQVWVSDGVGGYIHYELGVVSVVEFCEDLSSVPGTGYYFRLPVTPGTTYWFQIVNENGTDVSNGWIDVEGLDPVQTTAPAGSIIISDDSEGFPAAILDKSTGAFLAYPVHPAGEAADSIVGTGYCVQDGETATGVALLDTNLVEYASRDWSPSILNGIKSNLVDAYYVITRAPFPSLATTVDKISAVDASILDTWLLPVAFDVTGCFAVSRDEVYLYAWRRNVANLPILVYNLSTSLAEADLPTGVAGEAFKGAGDGYVDVNGVIITCKELTGGAKTGYIVGYNATTGAEEFRYTVAGSQLINHFCRVSDAPNEVLVWSYASAAQNNARFSNYDLDTGVLGDNPTGVQVTGSSQINTTAGDENSISNSCPVIVSIASIAPPVLTGKLTVAKVTDPDSGLHVFSFTIGPDIEPAFFDLFVDEEQIFDPIPVGVYSVVEDADEDWTPTYLVSNDPNNDNLNVVVGAGEDVVVMVVNQFISSGSGLYVLFLSGPDTGALAPPGTGKTNDDFYSQTGGGTNVQVAIPTPMFKTGFIEDKSGESA